MKSALELPCRTLWSWHLRTLKIISKKWSSVNRWWTYAPRNMYPPEGRRGRGREGQTGGAGRGQGWGSRVACEYNAYPREARATCALVGGRAATAAAAASRPDRRTPAQSFALYASSEIATRNNIEWVNYVPVVLTAYTSFCFLNNLFLNMLLNIREERVILSEAYKLECPTVIC